MIWFWSFYCPEEVAQANNGGPLRRYFPHGYLNDRTAGKDKKISGDAPPRPELASVLARAQEGAEGWGIDVSEQRCPKRQQGTEIKPAGIS